MSSFSFKIMRAQILIIMVGALLPFLFDVCFAQIPDRNQKEWTWKDSKGRSRTKAELDSILQKHAEWVKTTQFMHNSCRAPSGRSEFSEISKELVNADLSMESGFSPLGDANLRCAVLHGINLSGSIVMGADLRGAILSHSKLVKTTFLISNLGGANLSQADMSGATFNDSELGDSDFRLSNLNGAFFISVRMDKAQLSQADVKNVTFEPIILPPVTHIASVEHIESMTYGESPEALTKLRNDFKNAGFRDQERKVTYALKTRQSELLYKSWTDNRNWYDYAEYWMNKVFFDFTCQYGMNPGRILISILCIIFISSIVYIVFSQFSESSRLAIVVPNSHPENRPGWLLPYLNNQAKMLQVGGFASWIQFPIQLQPITASSNGAYLCSLVKQEWALFRVSLLFSLMSTFNIKFREIDFGRWLRLLTHTEYDIKATRWARMFSGLQALVSVYLAALLLLSYFGRPFE